MSVSSWIRDHPRPLECAYRHAERLFHFLSPLFAHLGNVPVQRIVLPLSISRSSLGIA